MLKKYSQLFSVLFFGIFSMSVMTASAIDLDEATRTVVKDGSGKTIVLTPEQVKRGKRLFNATCGACHTDGFSLVTVCDYLTRGFPVFIHSCHFAAATIQTNYSDPYGVGAAFNDSLDHCFLGFFRCPVFPAFFVFWFHGYKIKRR